MLETGDGLDLALKALGAERLGQLRVQHLERHRALVPEVVGQKHCGHAAPAQLAFEPVAVGQGGSEAGEEELGQGGPSGEGRRGKYSTGTQGERP